MLMRGGASRKVHTRAQSIARSADANGPGFAGGARIDVLTQGLSRMQSVLDAQNSNVQGSSDNERQAAKKV